MPNISEEYPDMFSPLPQAYGDGFSISPEKAEEARIENAFKRKDSTSGASLDNYKIGAMHAGDFTTPNVKCSTSLHGISNPNYGSSPTTSRISLDNVQQFNMSLTPPHEIQKAANSGGYKKGGGVKKASLFAWMTLQSVPEETIISPHILDFLEQTLEPIPTKTHFHEAGETSILSGDHDLSSYGNYVYASFPVDVIVYFYMQPSTFRFSCLPVSRVECMLQLPSLDIVFSSKRAEDELLQR